MKRKTLSCSRRTVATYRTGRMACVIDRRMHVEERTRRPSIHLPFLFSHHITCFGPGPHCSKPYNNSWLIISVHPLGTRYIARQQQDERRQGRRGKLKIITTVQAARRGGFRRANAARGRRTMPRTRALISCRAGRALIGQSCFGAVSRPTLPL